MLFKIEKATKNDIESVFLLSNDKLVREMSINQNEIKWENHVVWFSNKIKDEDCNFFIIKNKNNDFIGQVRFENSDNKAVVSISITEKYRGKNLAEKILQKCMDISDFKSFIAYIKPQNIPSTKTFAKLGYIYQKDVIERDVLLKEYIYIKP